MLLRGHSAARDGFFLPSSMVLLCKGLLRALSVSLVLILIITLLLYLTPLPERSMPYFVMIGMLASIISGSVYVGRRVEARGWLQGGITGLLYIIVILILGSFLDLGPGLRMSVLSRLFLGFAFGCLGGILGINS